MADDTQNINSKIDSVNKTLAKVSPFSLPPLPPMKGIAGKIEMAKTVIKMVQNKKDFVNVAKQAATSLALQEANYIKDKVTRELRERGEPIVSGAKKDLKKKLAEKTELYEKKKQELKDKIPVVSAKDIKSKIAANPVLNKLADEKDKLTEKLADKEQLLKKYTDDLKNKAIEVGSDAYNSAKNEVTKLEVEVRQKKEKLENITNQIETEYNNIIEDIGG